jgi:hypothetical protein
MRNDHFIKTRVPETTKQRVQIAAGRKLLTESIWLRQIIEAELGRSNVAPSSDVARSNESGGRRIAVRLLPGDSLLLKERAAARGTAPATYVSILIRSHLRNLTPLPKDELRAFREQVRELRAIGRNINQIARILSRDGVKDASVRDDLRSFLKLATAMREATRALLKANSTSWEAGHVSEES